MKRKDAERIKKNTLKRKELMQNIEKKGEHLFQAKIQQH